MTSAVPSLSRLSPSMPIESSAFTPSSLSSATTATGSVAERMHPSRLPAFGLHTSSQPSTVASLHS